MISIKLLGKAYAKTAPAFPPFPQARRRSTNVTNHQLLKTIRGGCAIKRNPKLLIPRRRGGLAKIWGIYAEFDQHHPVRDFSGTCHFLMSRIPLLG